MLKSFFSKMFSSKKKNLDYEKISLRASLKDMMKMRSLRSINISNYKRWKYGDNGCEMTPWLHSLKINMLNGYMDVFSPRTVINDHRAGNIIEDVSLDQYKEIYGIVQDILDDEANIPATVKRNILVKINR